MKNKNKMVLSIFIFLPIFALLQFSPPHSQNYDDESTAVSPVYDAESNHLIITDNRIASPPEAEVSTETTTPEIPSEEASPDNILTTGAIIQESSVESKDTSSDEENEPEDVSETTIDEPKVEITPSSIESNIPENESDNKIEPINNDIVSNETAPEETTIKNTTSSTNETTTLTQPLTINLSTEFILPELPAEECTPNWIELKTSCGVSGIQKGFFVDANDCYSLTGNEADKQAPPDNIYSSNFTVDTLEPVKAPNYLISRDGSEWKILEQDYIEKYLDFDFAYINDDYYRVDWKWNDPYVEEVLKRCSLIEEKDENECVNFLSEKYKKNKEIQTYFVDNGTEEEILNSPCKRNPECVKKVLTNEDTLFIVEEHINHNTTKNDFVKSHFDQIPFLELMGDVKAIKLKGTPHKILKGRADIIGTFNPIIRSKGSFYINLKQCFPDSNGLLIKFGLNSLLAQFNNSKTIENLTFTKNENITRYLDLDKDSNVTNATINLNGVIATNISPSVSGIESVSLVGGLDFGYNFTSTSDFIYRVTIDPWEEGFSAHGRTWGLKSTIHPLSAGSFIGKTCSLGVANNNRTCVVEAEITKENHYSIYVASGSGDLNLAGSNDVYIGSSWVGNHWSDLDHNFEAHNGYRTENPFLETGTVNGIHEWNWSWRFLPENGTQKTNDFTEEINSYLATCTPDTNNHCQVPILFHSDTPGGIQYSNINITYNNYPKNPWMDAANDTTKNWNYSGEFKGKEKTADFSQDLQRYLDNNTLCPPDQETCRIPLVFNSSSKGILRISNISIQYSLKNTSPPIIHEIIVPEILYVSSNLRVQVNVTDNQGVDEVNLTLNGARIALAYNTSTGFYENSTTAPGSIGIYEFNITAFDIDRTKSIRRQVMTVNPIEADLRIKSAIFNPSIPNETQILFINVTLSNKGGTDANNFILRFTIYNTTEDRNMSVPKASSGSTIFNWTTVYGNHTLTLKADYSNIITEWNESNNNHTRDIIVLDITPPPAPTVSANPPNWTSQTTHNISWNAVSDTNGIDHYEYQIDYGYWTSAGLSTSFITPVQSEGVHTVYVRAADIPGNLGNQGNVSIYIDNSAPNTPVVREWHMGKNWTDHSTPYYSWTDPGDVGSGVIKYIGELDGSTIQLDNNLTYHPNITSSGSHLFRIYAQDAVQHNSSWSNNITVYIDITNPSNTNITSSTHPNSNNWFNISIPIFNFSAGDDHSKVFGFFYIVDQNESTIPDVMNQWTTNTSINVTSAGGVSSISNNSENRTGLLDGQWYIHARAKDNVGNLGNSSNYLFKIDTTEPKLLNSSPANNSRIESHTPTIRADYLDMHAGVNTSAVILKIDGVDKTVSATINNTAAIYNPATAFSSGEHTVLIHLRDNALNYNYQNYTWTFIVVANESEGRTGIEQGVSKSKLTNYLLYTDQQIYVRYLNNTQLKGKFDKVAVSLRNQTWTFNFVVSSESFTNVKGLYNNSLVTWENQTLTEEEITSQVNRLINQTVWP